MPRFVRTCMYEICAVDADDADRIWADGGPELDESAPIEVAYSSPSMELAVTPERYAALCDVIDSAKMDEKSEDTDVYASEALAALGIAPCS